MATGLGASPGDKHFLKDPDIYVDYPASKADRDPTRSGQPRAIPALKWAWNPLQTPIVDSIHLTSITDDLPFGFCVKLQTRSQSDFIKSYYFLL